MIALWALAVVQDRVPAVASGAATASDGFDVSNVITLVLAIGSSTVLGAIINAFANRKKVTTDTDRTKADAAAELTGIATSLVAPLREQNRVLKADFDAYKAEQEAAMAALQRKLHEQHQRDVAALRKQHGDEIDAWGKALNKHAGFDDQLLHLLEANGIKHDLVPPPLYPPKVA